MGGNGAPAGRAAAFRRNEQHGASPRWQLVARWLWSVPLAGGVDITGDVVEDLRGPLFLCQLLEAVLPGTIVPGKRCVNTEAVSRCLPACIEGTKPRNSPPTCTMQACVANTTKALGIVTQHSGRRSALPTAQELYAGAALSSVQSLIETVFESMQLASIRAQAVEITSTFNEGLVLYGQCSPSTAAFSCICSSCSCSLRWFLKVPRISGKRLSANVFTP